MTLFKPDYYRTSGKDLFDLMEEGLITPDEYRGFMKGNIFKYVKRYNNKNGLEDLSKAMTYLDTLTKWERENTPSTRPVKGAYTYKLEQYGDRTK